MTSKGRCSTWEPQILSDAQELSAVLTEHLLRIKETHAQASAEEARRERDASQRESVRLLEQEATRKDRFLTVLSHELRTPLTPVLLVLESLETERSMLSAEVMKDVLLAKESLLLEVQLIDDLLDITRIAKGKMLLSLDAVDCHVILESALAMLQSLFQERRTTLTKDLTASNSWLQGDSAKLRQVFLNLLRNALKFTPVGGGRIDVRSWNSDGKLLIEIKDNGVGIKTTCLKKIFDPFEQGDTSVTQEFGGLGLGLSIVKGLVELHGGSVEASSEGKGLGSSFIVSLPLRSPRKNTDIASELRAGALHPSLNILFVEDNVATQVLLAKILTDRLGHRVWTASSVHQGLERASERNYDLLLSDIGLPDGSGLELIAALKERFPHLIAIALTGYGSDEDRRQALRAGFSAHLTKPIRFANLKQTIEDLCFSYPSSMA